MTHLPKTPPASSDFPTILPFNLCWLGLGRRPVCDYVGSACQAGTVQPQSHILLFSWAMG